VQNGALSDLLFPSIEPLAHVLTASRPVFVNVHVMVSSLVKQDVGPRSR
jgi:hypothetical protein